MKHKHYVVLLVLLVFAGTVLPACDRGSPGSKKMVKSPKLVFKNNSGQDLTNIEIKMDVDGGTYQQSLSLESGGLKTLIQNTSEVRVEKVAYGPSNDRRTKTNLGTAGTAEKLVIKFEKDGSVVSERKDQ